MKRLLAVGVATVAVLPLSLMLLLGLAATGSCATGPGAGPVSRLNADQMRTAGTVVAVGQELAVPVRGLVVAVATAMQESGLRNLGYGDRDSLGVFQQRPSQGWGSPAQILDPVYASTRFYTALLAVPGWQALPVTAAAQAVQRSAFPDAYAKWADEATRIVAAITGAPAQPQASGCAAASRPAMSLPAGSVSGVLEFAAAQVGDSYVLGANGPDAWDCSSLVRAAFATAGLNLPRTAAQQYDWLRARGGLAVSPARLAGLRPGDLLFSRGANPNAAADGEPVGHVALYAGGGVLIEAKGHAFGVTARRYSDAALGSVTWVGRLAPDPAATTTPSTGMSGAIDHLFLQRRPS